MTEARRDNYISLLLTKHPSQQVRELCGMYLDELGNFDKVLLYKNIVEELVNYDKQRFLNNTDSYDTKVATILGKFPMLSRLCGKYMSESDLDKKYEIYRKIFNNVRCTQITRNQEKVKYTYTPEHHFRSILTRQVPEANEQDNALCVEYFSKHKSEFEIKKEPVLYLPFKNIADHIYSVIRAEKVIEDIKFLWM